MSPRLLRVVQAPRRVPGELGATTLTTEYSELLNQLFYCLCDSCSVVRLQNGLCWATGTRSLSCGTWIRLEKFKNSAKSRKRLIADMNSTEIFELCETSSNKQCLDCALYWEDRHCLLYLWKMFKIFRKNKGFGQEQQRRLINSRLCNQTEHHSRCQTWTFWTATNVLQGWRNVAKSSSTQAWRK